MSIDRAADDLDFRTEVRAFLDEKFDAALRALTGRQAGLFAEPKLAHRWHRILFEQGWITPTWPIEHGGTGWTPAQNRIFVEECARVGTPMISHAGIKLCGPAIIRHGTEEQKAFFLPRLRSGEHDWCQGYSEPGAGSDLASLQCRAVRDGDHYVVNGSKIWTSHAHHANWIFFLVRTSTEGKPQAGISFLVAPMDTPGITVRPIVSMSGQHEVNEVFFDEVRVPTANLIGRENEGWTVAKAVLTDERGTVSQSQRIGAALTRLQETARKEASDRGGPLSDDPQFRRKYADLQIQALALEWTDHRAAAASPYPAHPAAMASMQKIQSSILRQQIDELRVEALGVYAGADQRQAIGTEANEPVIGPEYALTVMTEFLDGRARTIYAGSSEIQRDILARTVLGL
jgi:alkylation response protein AidB-like acyl-CoA dehydrogenase